MTEYTYKCKYCPNEVTRKVKRLNGNTVCFDCKERRHRAYGLKYSRGLRSPLIEKEMPAGISEEERLRFIKEREKERAVRRKEAARLATKREVNREVEKKRRTARELIIIDMLSEGMTLNEIGAAMVPQISRERARQIIAKIEDREGIKFERTGNTKKFFPMVTVHCELCPLKWEIKQYFYDHSKTKLFHCKEHYHLRTKYLKEDGTRMTPAEINRWRYHHMPGRKLKQKLATVKYHKRRMVNDRDYRERFKKYHREYQQKKKDDPGFRERQREAGKRQWERIKADPERYAVYRAKQKIRDERRRARLSPR